MDETTKEKINWQRLLITSGLVLATAAIIGGGVWYYMNQNEQAQTKSYNDSVASLQKQIDELKTKQTSAATKTTPTTSTADVAYTNTFANFSFKIPAGYTVGEQPKNCEGGCAQTIEIFKKTDDTSAVSTRISIFVTGYVKDRQLTLEKLYTNDTSTGKSNKQSTKVGNYDAIKYDVAGMGTTTKYIVIAGDSQYQFTIDSEAADTTTALNKIISTFTQN